MDPKLKALDQQVIVITGASSGIGLATAVLAASKGARLVLASRSAATLEELAERLAENGGQAIAVTADVAERDQVEAIARAAIERWGRIDTWVNNAGVSIYGKLEEVDDADSRRLFDVNFWGVVNGSLAALPYLKAGGGALINVGSEVSDAVVPLQGMYSASKHAVKGFTDALRIELQQDHQPVSVTLIQPTAVDTPYPEHARNYDEREAKLPSPMIKPEQVAAAIVKAAAKPTRAVKVGLQSKVNTLMAGVAPKLMDWLAGKQIERQHHDHPAIDPEGTLYRAGETGRMHGRPPEAREPAQADR